MYRYGGNLKLSKFDQDNMAKQVEKWKIDNPEDNFFFRGYGEILDKSEVEKMDEIKNVIENITSDGPIHKIDLKDGDFMKKVIAQFTKGSKKRKASDENEDEDDGDVVEPEKFTSSERLLFVHQTKKQRALLKRYGNHLGLLDATWKTTKYIIPSFFLVVKTNTLYQIAGSFVVQDETGPSINEALTLIKSWNPDWDPLVFIVDNCNQEINAL